MSAELTGQSCRAICVSTEGSQHSGLEAEPWDEVSDSDSDQSDEGDEADEVLRLMV